MCEVGKKWYDEWWENTHLAEILDFRWRHGSPVGATPGETNLSREEVNRRLHAARIKFMDHINSCRHCKDDVFID
jgi:hypothetical protein